MFDLPWVSLVPSTAPIKVGATVAVVVEHFGFWSINPCRIVYTLEDSYQFGFAYGTIDGHSEIGEERFLVEMDATTGDVWYRILAYSRPTPLIRPARPLARMLQKRFARGSLAAMTASVRG